MHTQFFHLSCSLSLVISVPPPYSLASLVSLPTEYPLLVSRFSLGIFFPLPRSPPAPRFCVNLHSLLLFRLFCLLLHVCLWRSFFPATLYLPRICVYQLSLPSFYYRYVVISRNQLYEKIFLSKDISYHNFDSRKFCHPSTRVGTESHDRNLSHNKLSQRRYQRRDQMLSVLSVTRGGKG